MDLLNVSAEENIRLEFKSVFPQKDEMLKKLSSFANTYGGYMVIGAEANQHGRLIKLTGIQPQSSLKQKIVQWCYDNITPIFTPYVSDPIEMDASSKNVCYVIFVEESANTPHFLNNRKGCYIRTDEFSQRFEPQLATYEELQHLSDRRKLAIQNIEKLFKRSNDRFETYIGLNYADSPNTSGKIGATLKVAVVPQYPQKPLVEETQLKRILDESQIKDNRGNILFPFNIHTYITQYESIIIPNADVRYFSILDINSWGQLYYATEIENEDDKGHYVLISDLTSRLFLFLFHTITTLNIIGYHGSIGIRIKLEKILRKNFITPQSNRFANPFETPSHSPLDQSITFSIEANTEKLNSSLRLIIERILRIIAFSINWKDFENKLPILIEEANSIIGNTNPES